MVLLWIFLGVMGYQREHLSQRNMTAHGNKGVWKPDFYCTSEKDQVSYFWVGRHKYAHNESLEICANGCDKSKYCFFANLKFDEYGLRCTLLKDCIKQLSPGTSYWRRRNDLYLKEMDYYEQEKVYKASKLQAIAMHFTEEAINNMTRGLTDANTTSVVIKAEELQGYARVDVWDLLYDGSLNKRERQMVSDNLDFQDYAQYDLFLARNTTKKEAMTNMKNALNDEEKAFYELIKLKAFIAAQDEKKKEDLLKPGKKAQEEDAVDKNFWKNP